MASDNGQPAVRWPAQAFDHEGDDLAAPMVALSQALRVLEDDEEVREFTDSTTAWKTPASVQVITAGASSFSKWVSAGLAAVGGTPVVIAAVTGFWQESPDELRITYTASLALLLGASIIALAIIVRADLSARAAATTARYRARATISDAYLTGALQHRPAQYMLKTKGGSWELVKAIDYDAAAREVVIVTNDGNKVHNREIEGLKPIAMG
jgi:hypothetical protein